MVERKFLYVFKFRMPLKWKNMVDDNLGEIRWDTRRMLSQAWDNGKDFIFDFQFFHEAGGQADQHLVRNAIIYFYFFTTSYNAAVFLLI